jgi:Tfp pilus assembly protein PilV
MKTKAFSLMECMVTLVLLLITVGAIMSFRCYTVMSAQRAADQLLAAHAAQLISEAWRAAEGNPAFDPSDCSYEPGFRIEADPTAGQAEGAELPDFGGSYAGSYKVRLNGRAFQAHLYYQDYPGTANMRSVHVFVVWQDARRLRYQYHLPTLTHTL